MVIFSHIYSPFSWKFLHSNIRTLNSLVLSPPASKTPFSISPTLLFGSLASLAFFYQTSRNKAHACGIVGCVGSENVVPYLLEGLQILENRGYDSVGISTLKQDGWRGNHSIITTKLASKSTTADSMINIRKSAPSKHTGDLIGIAHTRWATHGGKTDSNAHPHSDQKNRIALVHNGTIENVHVLKKELMDLGYTFKSETDTEVIAQLIGYYLDKKDNFMEAVKHSLGRLEGTWGLAIIHRDHPNEIVACRHGSPLVVGLGDDKSFIASETTAFSRYTKKFIGLTDDEIAVIKADGSDLDLLRVEHAEVENIKLSPDPYPHWTLKEIMEQPKAVSRALNYGGRLDANGEVKLGGFFLKQSTLLDIHHLVFAACGTSYYASLYGAALMRSLSSFDSVQVVDAAEFNPDYLPSHDGGLLVVSQSGETKDTARTVELTQKLNIPVFSIINTVGSLIARSTKCGVYINAGREHAVASTKAFTTQITVMALVAAWFSQYRSELDTNHIIKKEKLLQAIHRLPTHMGMTLKTRDKCKELAQILKDHRHLFVLGKGYAESIAKEGALKIKEITYLHAEGFPGGALKHGPFALIEEGTPIILLILDDENASTMRTAAHEVKGRGAYTIVITDKRELASGIADFIIEIPNNGPLSALLAVIPLQLLAYEIAISRGINPDKPKNLAKAVTVD